MSTTKKPVLYIIVCAAPPAQTIHEFVGHTQALGWDVCVIATPQATRWISISALEALTEHVVRTDHTLLGEGDPLPKADAMIVLPATFNTINKWAAGIGDTLAVSILCEALGRGTPPIILVPCLKMDLVRHPAFAKSITFLRECGVCVLHEPERYPSPLMVLWSDIEEALQRVYNDLLGEVL